METVAIFGVGLIGGSFALALRAAGFRGQILGVSSQHTIQRALELRVVDKAATAQEAAQSADLIYLSQPILQIINCMTELNAWVRPEALVTDAGSTKAAIVERAAQAITRCQFLGGHPMAGRERRGVEAAEANLFEGRPYALTPRSPAELETPAVQSFIDWIGRIGSFTVLLEPGQHDRIVAYTSHLPQLASTALAALMDGRPEPQSRVFGPALVDSTRLALSAFDIWGDILATNREPIREALAGYIATLEEIRAHLEPEPMRACFDRAGRFAGGIRGQT
ncbi:MAG TPA: prephenate dehydrogenase/arogenate dehydrogenase family protein [Bryobacteraceae bacterium]|nr:prephenate dehydrogenase/arogenate dehydrogenase family protein [Bryobacteraceae bacterium]